MSDFSNEEIEEFKIEATELLDEAENKLLSLDKGGDFKSCYDAVFRVFHSLKGASGFLGLDSLQHHMHQLESQYQDLKVVGSMTKAQIGYFLSGIDTARKLLAGEEISFDHSEFERLGEASEVTKDIPEEIESVLEEVSTPVADPIPAPAKVTKPNISVVKQKIESNGKHVILAGLDQNKSYVILLLQKEGYEVTEYSDIFEALANAESISPDIMILPQDGEFRAEDSVRILRKTNPNTDVIVTVHNSATEYVAHDVSVGVLDVGATSTVMCSQLNSILNNLKLSRLMNETLDLLYDQLPDLSIALEKSGNEKILKDMDEKFKKLIVAKRQLKVS